MQIRKKFILPHEQFLSIYNNRQLLWALIKRDIIGRYKGAIMGLMWSFFNPLVMLAVYTFVFGEIFKSRWVSDVGSKASFALVLFCGLLVFNLFAECVTKAPLLIVSNVNYVKKVVFPLEILPIVVYGAAFFHLCIGFVVWLIFYMLLLGSPKFTMIFFPLILLPVSFFALGVSWFLASLGVYLRDIGQVIGVATSALVFLSPIFYPISSLPPDYQMLMYANPLTWVIETARDVLMWGKQPDWYQLGQMTLVSLLVAWAGFVWFQNTRKGFADVL